MNIDKKEAPLKIWVWIVIITIISIISLIPFVGVALTIIFCIYLGFFNPYKSLQNFGRAYLCFLIIILIFEYLIL